MNEARVVITGGSGLIGRSLASDLVSLGYTVIVLSRQPEKVQGLPEGVQAERWDSRLIQEASIVVNLAGENLSGSRWNEATKRRILESRRSAGEFVLRAVAEAAVKPRLIIQASAVGYYGPRGDEEVSEESPPGNDFLARVCQEWEAASAGVEALGVRRAVIRSGVVLSARGGALPRLLAPFRLYVGGPLGDGNQWFPWIHIADEVGAIRFLIDNEKARGPFNLVAPDPATNALFSRAIGEVLGRPSSRRVPAFALRLLLGEMSMMLLEGQKVVPRRLQELGYVFRFPDVRSALEDLVRGTE